MVDVSESLRLSDGWFILFYIWPFPYLAMKLLKRSKSSVFLRLAAVGLAGIYLCLQRNSEYNVLQ